MTDGEKVVKGYMLYSDSLTMPSKAISIRLPEEMAAELAAIARTLDVPVSETIREAIEDFMTSRRSDKGFQERLRKRLEDDREILERFAE
jgi:predicted DNA-binding protein